MGMRLADAATDTGQALCDLTVALDGVDWDAMRTIKDLAPPGVEAGVGLVLTDPRGRYLFFLAGSRHHHCRPGELFYAGLGGHREPGEGWLDCAHREAREEMGAEVEILPASSTWLVPWSGPLRPVTVSDRPCPLAFYEMIHPPGTPRAGELYCIVIYLARLLASPADLPPEEVAGMIALTAQQVVAGLDSKPTLTQLLDQGAKIVTGGESLDSQLRLYPLGTAVALARLLQQGVRPRSQAGHSSGARGCQ